jgi:zinc protease
VVEASNEWGIEPELFWIYAQARPKKTAEDLEERIDAVLEHLGSDPVPEAELRKARTQLKAQLVRNLKTVSGKANQLGFFDTVLGDYRAMFGLEAAWEKVGAGDVKRVAAAYLQPAQRTVVVLEPIPSGRPAKDEPPRPGGVS